MALLAAQLLLSAGVGHAAMHDGSTRRPAATLIMPSTSSASPAGSAACCPSSTACVWRRGAGVRLRSIPWRAFRVMDIWPCAGTLASGAVNRAVDSGGGDRNLALGTHAVDQMCAGRRDGGNCLSEQVCSGTAHVGKRFAGGKPDPANHAGLR